MGAVVSAIVLVLFAVIVIVILLLIAIDPDDQILTALGLWGDRGSGIIFVLPAIVLVVVAVGHRLPELAFRSRPCRDDNRRLASVVLDATQARLDVNQRRVPYRASFPFLPHISKGRHVVGYLLIRF